METLTLPPQKLTLSPGRELGCPLCGNLAFIAVMGYRGKSALFQKRRIIRCQECHLCRIDPMPTGDELNAYYHEGLFWEHVTDKTPFDIPTYHHQTRARIAYMRAEGCLQPGVRLLDIGAGFGVLEKTLRSLQPDVQLFAVEPDPNARRSLENLGVFARSEQSSFQGFTFDLIILSHVLEHINTPIEYLKSLQPFCHRDTRLFVELPNEDHLFKIYLEPHVLFFNPQTLSVLLNKGGFQVKSIRTCGIFRSKQKLLNKRIERRQQILAGVPFKPVLKKIKRWLHLERSAASESSILERPDIYECAVYGDDRIWIRSLAGPL